MLKKAQVRKSLFGRCHVLTNHETRGFVLNYRDRAKILLAMLLDLAKSGGHEVCSGVHRRLPCVCIANIRGLATALSGKTRATVWRRSDYRRRRFDSIFCWRSSHYSAEIEVCLLALRR